MRGSSTLPMEERMAALHCPHCGASIPAERTWAQAAVSTLMPSPAIPDMATQVRCPRCRRLSAGSDLRSEAAGRSSTFNVVAWCGVAALVAWAVLVLLQR